MISSCGRHVRFSSSSATSSATGRGAGVKRIVLMQPCAEHLRRGLGLHEPVGRDLHVKVSWQDLSGVLVFQAAQQAPEDPVA